MEPEYIHQAGEGFCCTLIALLNARRFYGMGSPEPGEPEYEDLVDLARCRHGSALDEPFIAAHLGLRLGSPGQVRYPYVATVTNPEKQGSALHAILVTRLLGETDLEVVNYHWIRGPVVEVVHPDLARTPYAGRFEPQHVYPIVTP